MSDTVTLIAGILLTSVGLFALSPFVIRLIRDGSSAAFPSGFGRLLPVPDASLPVPFAAPPEVSVSEPDWQSEEASQSLDELMAHLFGLRMIVSEVADEVQSVQDILAGAEPEDAEAPFFLDDEETPEEFVA